MTKMSPFGPTVFAANVNRAIQKKIVWKGKCAAKAVSA